ncbi:portal protein [Methylocystis heyeri]|uniref:Hemophilus-specific protein n=1 Tax=Methylocystis heyeri TaxID=391905 RepID=A0A6B8KEQ5_9HYPH|nr:hemophilus-specific protein [Methylocystis heyeri]QGM46109.1 hemophilus-specific protein [Methylocystis heyeri]
MVQTPLQAIPLSGPGGGLLRAAGPNDLSAAQSQADEAQAQAQDTSASGWGQYTGLAGYVKSQYDIMRRHRNDAAAGWAERLMNALRVFNGRYSAEVIAQIRRFGGSEVYARTTAVKCRGATSLLADVYLSNDRPWGLEAPNDPQLPAEVLSAIASLIQLEVQSHSQASGQSPDEQAIMDRYRSLMEAARRAAVKRSNDQAKIAEDKIDEILAEGGFYQALAEFLADLTLFPYAVIKGPVVRIKPLVEWEGNKAYVVEAPKLTWERVSPFDVYWTPGVSRIEDGNVIERLRVTRKDLNDLLDLPGYDHDAVRAALEAYGRGGLVDDWDQMDAERAVNENRENPHLNRSGMISAMEFNGYVQGSLLLEQGMDPALIEDPLRDYFVQVWIVGRFVLKVQLSPSPRKRHQYYVTSFEKVPGTPVGNALPDILDDLQNVTNATLRSLVNNMSIASGPQVVVNDDLLARDEDGEDLYPWKRWHVTRDPFGSNAVKPIDFFQPTSNASELLNVFQTLGGIADELSAIPRYLTGSPNLGGGLGRTASGLSMLMSNSSKILQTVAANIDRDVLEPMLQNLFDLLMLTDTSELLSGEERITVLGTKVAAQRETNRQRQTEFLQMTANPVDMGIIGPKGRAEILRQVAKGLGLPGDEIVPSDDDLMAQQAAAQQAAQQQGAVGHTQGGNGQPGVQGGKPGPSGEQGPRVNLQQQTPQH